MTFRRRATPTTSAAPLVVALVVALAGALAVACTPEQFQRWWVDQGNAPLPEPQLSEAAAGATAFWQEVGRRNRFVGTVSTIDSALAARMTPTSWRPGCPVALSQLRYLRLSHMGLDGAEHLGEMVVHADVADAVVAAFRHMWQERFAVASMRLVDDFGGSDPASMAADNTTAFNCRYVAGTTRWSEHAWGRAVDINPVENPSVAAGVVDPAAGAAYLDRGAVRPGMLLEGSAPVDAFDFLGWGWGGRWSSSKDYQHVSRSGR